jgi:hypothetical protein
MKVNIKHISIDKKDLRFKEEGCILKILKRKEDAYVILRKYI